VRTLQQRTPLGLVLFANDLLRIGVNGCTGAFGRLILKLFAAWRVGNQFSKQLNLKRRVPNCGRYRDAIPPRLVLNGGIQWTCS
jgi:hypothetical protein